MFARITCKASNFKQLSRKFGASGRVLTWGVTTSNIGRENNIGVPTLLDVEGVTSVSMGRSHSALVDGKGNLYTFGYGENGSLGNGSESYWSPRPVSFFEHSGSVKEVSCGINHTVVCTKDGEVYTWGKNVSEDNSTFKSPMRIDFQNTAISQVGAGDHFSMALSEDGKQVYVWGVFVPLGLDNIVYPTECKEVSEWLQAHGTSIKKMRVSGHAVAFQTTDGGLFVWGDNKYGQLANNHMREDIYDTILAKPQIIYPSYEGKIEDFDLSENMLVFRTSTNEVYFAGLWKYFIPFKCQLPESVQVKSIGAAWDGFGVVDQNGRVYGWNDFLESPRKYFDANLSVSTEKELDGHRAVHVGGSYQNKFIITA